MLSTNDQIGLGIYYLVSDVSSLKQRYYNRRHCNREFKAYFCDFSPTICAFDKGQLISECLFDMSNIPKNQRKI